MVFKSWSEGDFTQDEILELENLYVIISQAYINFKRHEQAQIISSMKDKVIHSSSREYFITDGFSHVLQASDGALHLLNEQFGLGLSTAPDPEEPQRPAGSSEQSFIGQVSVAGVLRELTEELADAREARKKARMLSVKEERMGRAAVNALQELLHHLAKTASGDIDGDYGIVKAWFSEREKARKEMVRMTDAHISNAFRFVKLVHGEGQEMVIFLSEIASGYYTMKFINEHGNEEYFRYNELLLLKDRRRKLQEEIFELGET